MASEVAKRLRDQRLNLWEQAKAISGTAVEENRMLEADEQGQYDKLMEEMERLDVRIKSILETEKRMRLTDDAFDAVTSKKPDRHAGGGYADSGGRDINAEVRAVLRGEQGAPKAVEVMHSGGAFGQAEYRTLLSNSGSATSVVPTDFYDRLLAYLIEVSGILQCGPSVLNTSGGETLQLPQATAHGGAAIAGQGSAITAVDPTFGQKTLTAFKYGQMVQVARELIDDSAVDLLGYLAMRAGRAVGNAFGSDLINGAGSTAPAGLIFSTSASPAVTGGTAASMSATGGTTGSPSYGNLVDMEYSVIAPYRQSRSCYWLAADKTVGALRKITDTTGRPVWEPSTVLGSPDLLLGKPIVADPFMPAMGANALSIAFGDFEQFFVRLVGGVRFERSDDYAFNTDLITFRCLIRGDGTLTDTNAVKLFKGGAS